MLAGRLIRQAFCQLQPQLCRSIASQTRSYDVIVVGGGIIGSSVLYHLSKLGKYDTLLLEKGQLTSGTTWHAAGLMVTFGSLSSASTTMRKYSKKLYSEILPDLLGIDNCCGFHPVGFIELATSDEHYAYYKRVASFNKFKGIQVEEISPNQVKDLFPLCSTDDVVAGFYVPTDGRVNPVDVTMSLVKGASIHGNSTVKTNCKVVEVLTDGSSTMPKATGVRTECGHVFYAKKAVINCTGLWACQFAQQSGVVVPNQAAEHYYLLTEPMPSVNPGWPILEDPSRFTYIRPEGGGLMVGLFETTGASVEVPENDDFSFKTLPEDWDRMMPYIEKAFTRIPEASDVGIKQLFCGPESFTPDNLPVVGPAPNLSNYYVAAGMNSIGILTGGGIGSLVAEWVDLNSNDKKGVTSTLSSPKSVDVTGIHVNRFDKHQSNPMYRKERVVEALGMTYALPFPHLQPRTCRGIKRTPLHFILESTQNPCFKLTSGWESPMYYGKVNSTQHSFGRESWYPIWKQEHEACREAVCLFDMSFMSKILVQGRDAEVFLNRLSTARIFSPSAGNKITYTQWLNDDGRMEADVTIINMSPDKYLVVATDTMQHAVLMHMMHALSPTDASNSNRYVTITDVTVGELGYELFVPAEYSAYVYNEIVQVGFQHGLRHAGLKALGSLRLEKGYRDYGHDMDNTDTLVDCGLDFTCDFTKSFVGSQNVLKQRKEGRRMKALAQVLVVNNPEPLLHHGEILWRNGQPLGEIRSSSYGWSLGGSVGLAMLESDEEPITVGYTEEAEWQVETPQGLYPCKVSLRPLYDPKNLKMKN